MVLCLVFDGLVLPPDVCVSCIKLSVDGISNTWSNTPLFFRCNKLEPSFDMSTGDELWVSLRVTRQLTHVPESTKAPRRSRRRRKGRRRRRKPTPLCTTLIMPHQQQQSPSFIFIYLFWCVVVHRDYYNQCVQRDIGHLVESAILYTT